MQSSQETQNSSFESSESGSAKSSAKNLEAKPQERRDKLSDDRVKGSFGIGVGILLAVGMQALAAHVSQGVLWALWLPSTAIFVSGCVFYSRSKGYSPYLGLLGFGWIFGLVPLLLLPDRKDTTLKDLQAEFMARRNGKRQQ